MLELPREKGRREHPDASSLVISNSKLYPSRMPKWLKTFIAFALLPLCVGAALTLMRLLRVLGNADTFWVAVLGGAGCWLSVFLLLPKPMWVYVFGHELTHVLWTWLFGGRVKKFNVTSKGGHVLISKSNFLIVLAPYFFPLYVLIIVLFFALGHVLLGWNRHWVWLHFLVGMAYAFHVTLTWHILQTQQSDITSQGYLFSAVIIFLGNISVLLIGLPMVTARVTTLNVLGWWLEESGRVVQRIGHLF